MQGCTTRNPCGRAWAQCTCKSATIVLSVVCRVSCICSANQKHLPACVHMCYLKINMQQSRIISSALIPDLRLRELQEVNYSNSRWPEAAATCLICADWKRWGDHCKSSLVSHSGLRSTAFLVYVRRETSSVASRKI